MRGGRNELLRCHFEFQSPSATEGAWSSSSSTSNNNMAMNIVHLEGEATPISTKPSTCIPVVEKLSKKPFTLLSQEEADFTLARTLQEQERAYLLLQLDVDSSGYETSGSGESDNGYAEDTMNDEDDFYSRINAYDAEFSVSLQTEDIDPTLFENDEAYVRALQDAVERQMASQMISSVGLEEGDDEYIEDDDNSSEDVWQDIDPDSLSYEELLALSEIVGTESKGIDSKLLSSLPVSKFEHQSSSLSSKEKCVICCMEYESGDSLINLPCNHVYHSECIGDWLKLNKVCPVCNKEVSTKRCQ